MALICPAAEAFSNPRYILQSSLSVCDSILMSCGVYDIDSIFLVNKQSKFVKCNLFEHSQINIQFK